MHILFEGAVPYVIGHLLKRYILVKKKFTLKQLNRRLHDFHYGYSQMADRLQAISEEMLRADWGDKRGMSSFGGHGAKNWLFLRIPPFLIGDWIDMESREWKIFEKLFAICALLVSPVLECDRTF